jgi:hypothetical protein
MLVIRSSDILIELLISIPDDYFERVAAGFLSKNPLKHEVSLKDFASACDS